MQKVSNVYILGNRGFHPVVFSANCDILGRAVLLVEQLGNRRSQAATGKRPLLLLLHHHDHNEDSVKDHEEDPDDDDDIKGC